MIQVTHFECDKTCALRMPFKESTLAGRAVMSEVRDHDVAMQLVDQ
jgi:hypothetical protein